MMSAPLEPVRTLRLWEQGERPSEPVGLASRPRRRTDDTMPGWLSPENEAVLEERIRAVEARVHPVLMALGLLKEQEPCRT